MDKKLIALTGPSGFSKNVMSMVEDYFDFNYVCLNYNKKENNNYWLEKCDGIIIVGGVDIHPSIYGKNVANNFSLSKFDISRDMQELSYIKYAMTKNKPLLAICRGHQLLSIYLGLGPEFVMDLNDCETVHQPSAKGITASEEDVMHYIELVGDFKLPKAKEREQAIDILGESEKIAWVNSFHHQGVLYLNTKNDQHYSEKGITVMGLSAAEFDKKLRLIELMRGKNWVSVQWHPEYDYDKNTPSRTVLELYKDLFKGA